MNPLQFTAPWCRSLRWVSVLVGALLFLLPVGIWVGAHEGGISRWPLALGMLGPWGIVLASACFTVRGYGLDRGELRIRRWFWTTRKSLHGLRDARWDPAAIRGAWRVAGNGGLFSFSGYFRNRTLGWQRWWVTDPSLAVVLDFGARTWVVSPGDPAAFVAALGFSRNTDENA
ncbi:MAG: hypothetical protein RI897_527 [Verrucomicrobiota bacterium]|jgi:hypothetical protein